MPSRNLSSPHRWYVTLGVLAGLLLVDVMIFLASATVAGAQLLGGVANILGLPTSGTSVDDFLWAIIGSMVAAAVGVLLLVANVVIGLVVLLRKSPQTVAKVVITGWVGATTITLLYAVSVLMGWR